MCVGVNKIEESGRMYTKGKISTSANRGSELLCQWVIKGGSDIPVILRFCYEEKICLHYLCNLK